MSAIAFSVSSSRRTYADQPSKPIVPPSVVPAYVREPDERTDPLKSLSGLTLEEVEKALVVNTLKDVGGNRERAARLLGVSTRTLYRKIQEYGLSAASPPALKGTPAANG